MGRKAEKFLIPESQVKYVTHSGWIATIDGNHLNPRFFAIQLQLFEFNTQTQRS